MKKLYIKHTQSVQELEYELHPMDLKDARATVQGFFRDHGLWYKDFFYPSSGILYIRVAE